MGRTPGSRRMRHAGAEAAGLGLGCMGMSVFSGPGNRVRGSPPPRRRASEAAWHRAEGDDGRDEAREHQCRHTSAGCAETGSILRKVDRRQRERNPHQVAHPSAWHQGALDERGGRSREDDPFRSLVNAAHERGADGCPTVCPDHNPEMRLKARDRAKRCGRARTAAGSGRPTGRAESHCGQRMARRPPGDMPESRG